MRNELVILHVVTDTTSAEFIDLINWKGDPGYRYSVNELFYDTDWLGAAGICEVDIKINGSSVDNIKSTVGIDSIYVFLMLHGRLVFEFDGKKAPRFQLRFRSDGTNVALIEFYMSMIKEKI